MKGDKERKDKVVGAVSYSFASTHPGLWRRTSMRVFVSVVLNRMDALCSLKDKATARLLEISYFFRMIQGQKKGGRKKEVGSRITEFLNLVSSQGTLKIIKLRITESLNH